MSAAERIGEIRRRLDEGLHIGDRNSRWLLSRLERAERVVEAARIAAKADAHPAIVDALEGYDAETP